MSELLSPKLLDLTESFNKEFLGMTQVDITLNDLLTTRNLLIKTIQQSLTSNEKEFLLSIKRGDPL